MAEPSSESAVRAPASGNARVCLRGRRRFVAASGAIAALAPLASLAWAGDGGDGAIQAAQIAGSGLLLVRRAAHAFGTGVSISVVHGDPGQAERAIDAALREIRAIESVFSLYRGDSQLVELNRTGRLGSPHPMLVEVLARAQSLSATTHGAFDVTVQPLWQLWSRGAAAGRLPVAAEIDAARRRTGWRRLQVARDEIALRGDGMSVTLNGIAQGYAGDRVMAVLGGFGIAHALIDTGELGALGSNGGGRPWSIGVRSPRPPMELLGTLATASGFVATSGDYETAFSADLAHHHILDPRTGDSPTELSSVTVVAPTGLLADGLSTAAFVLGAKAGRALVERHGARALFVRKDGVLQSVGGLALRPAPAG